MSEIKVEPVDCKECQGTGNFYRHDEDGDVLDCDHCNGIGQIEAAIIAVADAVEREGNG